MRMSRLAIVAVLFASSLAISQEKKTSIYGFMDMSTTYRLIDDQSLMKTITPNDFYMGLDHVNIYFDLQPNANTRFLTEIGYQSKPLEYSNTVGQTLIADIYSMGTNTTILKPPQRARDNVVTSPGNGMVFEWGALSIERAWFEYSFSQAFNLRLGKFITPAGIWNVDHGSPAILTANQPYETGLIPLFPKSQIGMMETGRTFLGEVDLDYSVYLSGGRTEYDITKPSDLAVGANVGALLPVLDGLELGVSAFNGKQQRVLSTQEIHVTVDSATVTAMTIQTMMQLGVMNPFDPSVMAAVGTRIQNYIAEQAANPENHTYTSTYTAKSRETDIGADFKLTIKGFTLQSEVNHQRLYNLMDDDKLSTQTGFYFLGSYRIPVSPKIKLTPYVMFERITAKDADNNRQLYLSESNVEGFQVFSGGVNIKLLTNITLKLEYNYADILTMGALAAYDDNMDFSIVRAQCGIAF